MSVSTKIARGEAQAKTGLLREALLQGRRAAVTVSSSSMEPTLRAGDVVTVEGAVPTDVHRGDIVVYQSPVAGLVVHRVVWKIPPFGRAEAVYTKGDALPYVDRPLAAAGILGRVVAVESGSRRRELGRTGGYLKWVATALAWSWRRGADRFGRLGRRRQEER